MGLPATARRVVRGGAWSNDQINARAADRNDNAPDNRNDNLGVRVVRPSHILIPLRRRSWTGVYLSGCCEPAHRHCWHGLRFQDWSPTTVCGPRRRL